MVEVIMDLFFVVLVVGGFLWFIKSVGGDGGSDMPDPHEPWTDGFGNE